MKKIVLPLLQYGIFLGLGIFLVWWSLHEIPDSEWSKFKDALRSARYWLIIPVFFLLTASHVLRTLRWRLLMEPMGYTPGFLNTFFAVMIGYLANLAIPRLGEVLKCTLLTRYEKVPVERVLGTIVAERAFDVISLLAVFLLALLLQFDVVTGSYANITNVQATTEQKDGWGGWVVLFLLVVALGWLIWIFVSGRGKALINKITQLMRGIWEGLISAGKIRQRKLFVFYTIAIWMLYLGGTWMGFYATAGTDHLGFQVAVSGLAFASIGMIITPGGIGAYAFLLALVVEQNGVDYAMGVANGTLQWFAQVLIVVVVGGICLLALPLYNKKIQNESSRSHPAENNVA
jgi:uncharacterized protein (TIRG00374 family)